VTAAHRRDKKIRSPRTQSKKSLASAIAATTLILAVAGAGLAAYRLWPGNQAQASTPNPQVRTSFGSVTVDGVRLTEGPPPDAQAGLHGGGVPLDSEEFQVRFSLTLENLSDNDVPYSPDRVRLFVRAEEEPARLVAESTSDPGILPPGGRVSLSMSFAVPTSDAALRFSYLDVDGTLTEMVDLETTSGTSAGGGTPEGNDHDHNDHDH
jgi:hypothetical protein